MECAVAGVSVSLAPLPESPDVSHHLKPVRESNRGPWPFAAGEKHDYWEMLWRKMGFRAYLSRKWRAVWILWFGRIFRSDTVLLVAQCWLASRYGQYRVTYHKATNTSVPPTAIGVGHNGFYYKYLFCCACSMFRPTDGHRQGDVNGLTREITKAYVVCKIRFIKRSLVPKFANEYCRFVRIDLFLKSTLNTHCGRPPIVSCSSLM
jgi:hypothetical protein